MSEVIPVSVCLLSYNRAHLLPATINSLLNQTYQEFELIICDDASTDGAWDICLQYQLLDKRIKTFRSPHNLGMPGNLNKAIGLASGSYIANLHDGDIYHSDLLLEWKTALDHNPSAGFVFNAYETINKYGETVILMEKYSQLIPGIELGKRLLSQWNSCVYGTVMARRNVYETIGLFDPQFANFSDVDMWLRIAASYDVAYVNKPLIHLMPRDPTRFYAFIHWQVFFWYLGIHVINLVRYRSIIPEFVAELCKSYPRRRRKLLLYNFMICIKHGRWDRVKEGVAIWRDSDDFYLRLIGKIFGSSKNTPEWYQASCWIDATYVKRIGIG